MSFELANRKKAERLVIKRAVEGLLGAGYLVSVDDGDYQEHGPFQHVDDVMLKIMQTDEEHLRVTDSEGRRIGWVFLVYGNEGWDVINDYSVNLESILGPALAYADQLDKQGL